jgi:hypothetical protein
MTRALRTIADAARTALAWAAFPFALAWAIVAVLFTREG